MDCFLKITKFFRSNFRMPMDYDFEIPSSDTKFWSNDLHVPIMFSITLFHGNICLVHSQTHPLCLAVSKNASATTRQTSRVILLDQSTSFVGCILGSISPNQLLVDVVI